MSTISTQQDLAYAQQLQQTGNLAEAERVCRAALLTAPDSPEILNLLGVVLSQIGQHDEGLAQLGRATALEPRKHTYLFNLGTVYAAKEKYAAAEDCFRRVLALSSSLPEGHYNLGNALKDQNRLDEAVACYRKALQLRSGYAAAWSNLGSAYIQLVKPDDAKVAMQRAISLNPRSPSALNNLASIARNEGDLEGALQHAVNALGVNPNFAEGYFTLGSILIASLDYKNGIIAYEKGVSLKQASKSALTELANAYAAIGAHAGIVETMRRMLAIDPQDARAQLYLAITQMERGIYDEADRAFQASLEIVDDPAVRIRQALTIRPIVASADEIKQIRHGLDRKLDQLAEKSGHIADPYSAQLGTNFFLAYHAMNNRSLQSKIARLYRQYAPSLNYVAPHCTQARTQKARIKVGFISKFIYRHSVAIAFSRVIIALSEMADFELFVISTTNFTSASVKDVYSDYQGNFICIPSSLPYAQQVISNLELDVLIYLDIGMDPFTFLLAFARLAPVQCVATGHPDTTGIDTLDYFISEDAAEPADGDTHYSEKLVRLPSGGFGFPRPSVPDLSKTRADFGLPLSGTLYLCPMMLQKLHPDFDLAMSEILDLDSTGHIVLFESFQHQRWGELLRLRLDATMTPTARKRVVFIPWIHDSDDFKRILALSDVILDPFHFGIGTTGAFAFAVGTPVVTLPGEFMRGRVGLQYYKALGVMDCVAANKEDYVKNAVEIGTNPTLREAIREKILSSNHRIFDNSLAYQDYSDFIRRVVQDDRIDLNSKTVSSPTS
jgi:predicted O-linked N-acetylglucosamine transferase (SPINDLY family)